MTLKLWRDELQQPKKIFYAYVSHLHFSKVVVLSQMTLLPQTSSFDSLIRKCQCIRFFEKRKCFDRFELVKVGKKMEIVSDLSFYVVPFGILTWTYILNSLYASLGILAKWYKISRKSSPLSKTLSNTWDNFSSSQFCCFVAKCEKKLRSKQDFSLYEIKRRLSQLSRTAT